MRRIYLNELPEAADRSLGVKVVKTELSQLIEALPDEIDVLYEAIAAWCENNPAIGEARSKVLEPYRSTV